MREENSKPSNGDWNGKFESGELRRLNDGNRNGKFESCDGFSSGVVNGNSLRQENSKPSNGDWNGKFESGELR